MGFMKPLRPVLAALFILLSLSGPGAITRWRALRASGNRLL